MKSSICDKIGCKYRLHMVERGYTVESNCPDIQDFCIYYNKIGSPCKLCCYLCDNPNFDKCWIFIYAYENELSHLMKCRIVKDSLK